MTPDDRAKLMEFRKNGATLQQIADRFAIRPQTVHAILARGEIRGRPCPKCGAGSKTIKTWPPNRDFTRRRHQCVECEHRWNSRQTDEGE